MATLEPLDHAPAASAIPAAEGGTLEDSDDALAQAEAALDARGAALDARGAALQRQGAPGEGAPGEGPRVLRPSQQTPLGEDGRGRRCER